MEDNCTVLTMFASQVVFISWVLPRAVSECVLVVMPRKSDGNVMPSNRATDASSVSPLATTSPDPLSAKFTLPKSNTAASTLTTSMNGMPRRPFFFLHNHRPTLILLRVRRNRIFNNLITTGGTTWKTGNV